MNTLLLNSVNIVNLENVSRQEILKALLGVGQSVAIMATVVAAPFMAYKVLVVTTITINKWRQKKKNNRQDNTLK